MNAAFSVWNGRIAPVFDNARQVVVIDVESGRVTGRTEAVLPDDLPMRKAGALVELGVEALVCGAISWPLHAMVTASGIRVIPFVAGTLDVVVRAWSSGTVERADLAMPGCRWRGGSSPGAAARAAGHEPGQGHGRSGWGRGWGRVGGAGRGAGGPAGTCVCLVCGHREPHQRGAACADRVCPACGAHLVRTS